MSTADRHPNACRCAADREILIAVEDLTKRYARRVAIENFALTLHPGEIYGFLGANGGGKTTTLRMLVGLVRPDRGQGQVLGFDLLRRPQEIRKHVGYMSQRFSLYSELSVFENLHFRAEVYGLRNPREATEAAIENFGLSRFASTPAAVLSGGWARWLQLAAALIHAPRLVLLDEPTAGLDAASRQGVWRRLGVLSAAGLGVIVSTHDLAEADRCSRTAVFSEGRVIATGTPEEVARSAHAAAFVWSGTAARSFSERILATPGVIAMYPQGGGLRIIVEQSREEHFRRFARSVEAHLARVPTRLEDAALAFSKKASQV
jgi:ABC-2 type transport system ATP-binding protein